MKFATMTASFDSTTEERDFRGKVETEIGDVEVRFPLNQADLDAIHVIIKRALADTLRGMN